MWELDNKKGWALKNWCLHAVVLEKTLESPLDCKEIKPVNLKGNQPWIFIGRTDAEAEAPVLWPPDAESQLTGKDPYAGKDCGQEEKGATEEEMVGWHHRLHGHEFEQTLGDSEGQGSLSCCSPCGCKELDMTEQLNKNKNSTQRYPFYSRLLLYTFHFKWDWSVKLLHIFYMFRFSRFNIISSANNYFAFSFPSCTS